MGRAIQFVRAENMDLPNVTDGAIFVIGHSDIRDSGDQYYQGDVYVDIGENRYHIEPNNIISYKTQEE